MSTRSLLFSALLGALMATPFVSSAAADDPDAADDTTADTTPDTSPDTASDTAPDTANDTTADTASDTAPDALAGIAADGAADTTTADAGARTDLAVVPDYEDDGCSVAPGRRDAGRGPALLLTVVAVVLGGRLVRRSRRG